MNHIAMLVTSNLLHDNRVRREAETLAGAGYQVTVFCHIRPEDLPRLGWADRTRLAAVPVPPAAWQSASSLQRVLGHSVDLLNWGGSRALLEAASGCAATVFHAHDLETLPAAAWLAQHHGARLVYDSHELFVDLLDLGPVTQAAPWPSRAKQRIAKWNYARLERALIGKADATITVGPAVAAELAARYGIRPPAVVLNTPNYRDLGAGSDYLRRRLGLAGDRTIVLFQGAILPNRGLPELVQSLEQLPPTYHLVCLGFNLGVDQEVVRREISRLSLQERVHLLDALPAPTFLEATASADVGIFLVPGHNKNEQFSLPNKVFEYMMAGLPFVATDWPEVAEVVRRTGAGVTIDRIAPDAIAGAVAAVMADPARYQAMRRAALEAARSEYNWEHQAGRLLAVYRDLLEK